MFFFFSLEKLIFQWKHCRALYTYPDYLCTFFTKYYLQGQIQCACTEHTWMHHSLPLNVKRSYTLRESHLNVSLVPFFTVWLCNRKTCICAISFQRIQHSSFAFSLPYQLGALLLSRWSLVHTQKNHRDESQWSTKRLFGFETEFAKQASKVLPWRKPCHLEKN